MNETLNILVVDDEEMIRTIFETYLKTASKHSVMTAQNGKEALDIIKAHKIDCCFTDLSMPQMDGTELTEKIQAIDNTIPVVVMTGYPSLDNAIKTLRNGVVDFLTKPFKMEQIPIIIERVMRERSLLMDNIILKEAAQKTDKLLKVNEELKEKVREVETINLILQQLDLANTSKELFYILVNLCGRITPCDEAHFCFVNPDIKEPAIITSFFRDESEAHNSSGCVSQDIIQKVAADGIPCLIRGKNGSGGLAAIPLKIRANIFGVLVAFIRNGIYSFSEKDLFFLNFLTEKASFLVENLALYENIYESLFSTLYAFVETIEARDPYTKQHSARVARYAMTIAQAYGCTQEEIDKLNISGYLHDIGKIGIPDEILLKPGRLTNEEFEVIKKHPTIGSNIIGHLGMWAGEQNIIRWHHERFDGSGYPDGLKGEEIPLPARILSVADVFDAVTSDRSYRRKVTDQVALKIIREGSGTQFDSALVTLFIDLYERGEIATEIDESR